MTYELKKKIEDLAAETVQGGITPARLAGLLEDIVDECLGAVESAENRVGEVLGTKSPVVDIRNYEDEGRVLPTLKAVFVSGGFLVHCRTIYENKEMGAYIHVFCCEHDGEYEDSGRGYRYVVFDNNRRYVRTYNTYEDDVVPVAILQAFGEALATEEYCGLISPEDKRQIGVNSISIQSLARQTNTAMKSLATTINELLGLLDVEGVSVTYSETEKTFGLGRESSPTKPNPIL